MRWVFTFTRAAYSAARSWHVTRHMKRQHPNAVEAQAEWSAQPGEQSVPDRMLWSKRHLPGYEGRAWPTGQSVSGAGTSAAEAAAMGAAAMGAAGVAHPPAHDPDAGGVVAVIAAADKARAEAARQAAAAQAAAAQAAQLQQASERAQVRTSPKTPQLADSPDLRYLPLFSLL